MGTNVGRGAGVIGLVDQSGTLVFKASLTARQGKVFAKVIDTTGRGDGGYTASDLEDISGSGSVSGRVMDKSPLVADFRAVTGTITYISNTGTQVSFPASVNNIDFVRSEKEQDKETVTFDWNLNGAYVITNPSTTPAGPSGSVTTKETYEQLQKTADTTAIATAAIQRIRVLNVADNDAAENAAITTAIGSTSAPIANLTLVDAVFTRTGNRGGFVILHWGVRNNQQAIEQDGTLYLNDPNNMIDKAQITQVTSSGTPPAVPTAPLSTVYHHTESRQLNSMVRWAHTFHYAERDTLDDVQMPDTKSERPVSDAFVDVVSNVVSCNSGDSTSSVANTEFAVFYQQQNAFAQETRRLTPTRAEIISTYRNPGVSLFESAYGSPRWVDAQLVGSTVNVYVAQCITRGSGSYWIQVVPFQIFASIRRFSIRRLIQGTTVPDQFSITDCVNNANFLGIGAGKVQYVGAECDARIDLSRTKNFYMTYHFYYDPNGIFAFQGMRAQWLQISTSVSPGFVDISTITGGNFNKTLPVTADFNPFIT